MQVRLADTAKWHIEQSRPARLESWKARGEFPGPSPHPRPRLSVTGAPILEAHSTSSLSGMMPRSGEEALQDVFDIEHLAAGPLIGSLCVVARDQDGRAAPSRPSRSWDREVP
jgi:hypothetical protein